MLKIAIIQGSSRNNGNTSGLVEQFIDQLGADYQPSVYDLNQYDIAPFDYQSRYNDDFRVLFIEILSSDVIVFTSPVYWYAPSAQLKLFLDRISDFLKMEKDLGRQLRGKMAATLSTGYDSDVADCFPEIFRRTFGYLSLDDLGFVYQSCQKETYQVQSNLALDALVTQIKQRASALVVV